MYLLPTDQRALFMALPETQRDPGASCSEAATGVEEPQQQKEGDGVSPFSDPN